MSVDKEYVRSIKKAYKDCKTKHVVNEYDKEDFIERFGKPPVEAETYYVFKASKPDKNEESKPEIQLLLEDGTIGSLPPKTGIGNFSEAKISLNLFKFTKGANIGNASFYIHKVRITKLIPYLLNNDGFGDEDTENSGEPDEVQVNPQGSSGFEDVPDFQEEVVETTKVKPKKPF
jgi:hypothetical protein